MNCDPTTVDRLLTCSKLHEGTKKYILKEAPKDRIALLDWEAKKAKKIAAPKPKYVGVVYGRRQDRKPETFARVASPKNGSKTVGLPPSYQLKLRETFRSRGLHKEGTPVEGVVRRNVGFLSERV